MRTVIIFSLLLLLVACGKKDQYKDISAKDIKPWTPKDEPLSTYGNHSPYRVHGQVYQVNNHPKGFTQKGQASWYGKQFHDRKTSNQEVFDMYKLTAAHKTLPLPSYVEVTNLKSDKKIVVGDNNCDPSVGTGINVLP